MRLSILALAITLATIVTWVVTGRDAYTKFEIVELSSTPVDESDPLAGTGFYDDESSTEKVVARDEFRLGLLPTPQGLFDKHMLSVTSILGTTWGLWLLVWVVRRRRRTTTHERPTKR